MNSEVVPPLQNRRIRALLMNVNEDARRSMGHIRGNSSIEIPARVMVPVAIALFSSGPPRKSA